MDVTVSVVIILKGNEEAVEKMNYFVEGDFGEEELINKIVEIEREIAILQKFRNLKHRRKREKHWKNN